VHRKEIGKYTSYVLEPQDVVVVMGNTEAHSERLEAWQFARDGDTGEWVGRGEHLYALPPEAFFDLFGGGQGCPPELTAQATDGENVFQIDGLPVTGQDASGRDRILELTAVDMATRNTIDEGVSNFKVG
jgi:hypothetical protein